VIIFSMRSLAKRGREEKLSLTEDAEKNDQIFLGKGLLLCRCLCDLGGL